MKITNFILIFILIITPFCVENNININGMANISQMEFRYNKILETATEDAMFNLVEVYNGSNFIKLNKYSAVKRFYNSLYNNFNIMDNDEQKEIMKVYIPLILITENDGFSLFYKEKTETEITEKWTEKFKYIYEDNNYRYYFTLGDFIKIYDKINNKYKSGLYYDFKEEFSNSEILRNFDDNRCSIIINLIQNKMNEYIKNHNNIAKEFGIEYEFVLPAIKNDDWNRTIDDTNIMIIFQGYPYNINGEYYNNYSVAGSRIRKSDINY